MRVDELLSGELVQRGGEPFREAARVHEDERRTMGADELEQAGMDRRPDGGALHGGDRAAWDIGRLAQAGHVLDGDLDGELECLLPPSVEHLHRPLGAVIVEAAEEAGDLVERALRRRQSDPLQLRRVSSPQLLETLDRQGEMRSPLGGDDRVDLVDDHRFDSAETLASEAREHEVERLRGRDEDIRGLPLELRALARRRVSGPGRDRRLPEGNTEALRLPGDTNERRAEVALDVHGERLQR